MKDSRCTFYIPVAYNDGREVPASFIIDIKKVLDTTFGGFTVKGPWQGCWEGQVEWMTEYNVVVPAKRVSELKQLVKVILKELGQKAMYFEEHKDVAEIIPLTDESDEGDVEEERLEPPKPGVKKGNQRSRKSKRGDTNA